MNDRLVRVIVGAELQSVQQRRRQTAVVRLVRTPHRVVQLPAEAWSRGLALLDQLVQHVLAADRRKHDIPHDAIGLLDRGLRDSEQQPGLASNAAKVSQQFLLDAVLGGGLNTLDRLD